jgi:hypothetical protein
MLRTLRRQFQTVDVKNIILPGQKQAMFVYFCRFSIICNWSPASRTCAFDNIEDDRQTTCFRPELYLRPDHSYQRIAESCFLRYGFYVTQMLLRFELNIRTLFPSTKDPMLLTIYQVSAGIYKHTSERWSGPPPNFIISFSSIPSIFFVSSPFPHNNQQQIEEWRDFSSMGAWTTYPRPCT